MKQWPPHALLPRLPRTLPWCVALTLIALVTLGNPVSWAAPVTAPPNQTVPPIKTLTYLPKVSLTYNNLIVTLRADGRFSTLLQTLEAANLTTALESAGPFTMFAPTDEAFAQLPSGALEQLLANPTGQLTQILLFHVLPGEYELDDFENGMEITTQQGSSIEVGRTDNGGITISDAMILTPTLEASNGVIHAIDAVLLPPPDIENFPFSLGENVTCAPNAGTTYFSGFVRDSNNNLVNGACVHIAFYGPRGTKCSGCDGVGDGIWGFSPFGGPAPAGTTVEIYVVQCQGDIPLGGQTEQTGFGNLTPQSPTWIRTLDASEQCTGITFYQK